MDNHDEMLESGEWGVNYREVMNDKKRMSVTRLLAAALVSEPYLTVKDFLIGLSDTDLETLMEIYDDGVFKEEAEEDPRAADAILIAEMLAQAEGLSHGDIEETVRRVSALSMFLVVESLARKGLVKIHRNNMSFGEDMGDKVVVERLES